MKIYCKEHLHNHRSTCHKSCRFCRTTINIKQCPTCTALFCSKCMIQHKRKQINLEENRMINVRKD